MATAAARPVAIRLDADLKERVRRLAATRERTPHWLMREAINQYVEREERRELFRRAGIEAWEQFQATGLHVTAAEADAWLQHLELGADVSPPACHE